MDSESGKNWRSSGTKRKSHHIFGGFEPPPVGLPHSALHQEPGVTSDPVWTAPRREGCRDRHAPPTMAEARVSAETPMLRHGAQSVGHYDPARSPGRRHEREAFVRSSLGSDEGRALVARSSGAYAQHCRSRSAAVCRMCTDLGVGYGYLFLVQIPRAFLVPFSWARRHLGPAAQFGRAPRTRKGEDRGDQEGRSCGCRRGGGGRQVLQPGRPGGRSLSVNHRTVVAHPGSPGTGPTAHRHHSPLN